MSLTLHSGKINKNAYKALIVAEYLDVKINTIPDFEMGVSNKTPEFLKLNPLGKVPVLETPDGPIFESNAIARYVAKLKPSTLLGSTPYEVALVDQWIDFASLEIDANAGRYLYPKFANIPQTKEALDAILSNLTKNVEVLNQYFATQTYLVGDSITLADIVLTSNLIMSFKAIFTKEFSSKYPHFERYFWTLINQPQVKKIVGEVVQGDFKWPTATPGKGAQPKPAALPVKAKAAPKAKEAPKPKEVAVDEEEEAPKPKAKNPLDLLPPSPFVIDNWKRLYSNTKAKDFAEVAIKGFWEMYDPEGWSFWFADYRYNEENDKTYLTMNKVGGFLQRLDFIRKYAFGKVLILGEQPPYKIKSVWLFRGPEIPKQVLDECYDVELYTWTKADLSTDKERINAYFEEPDFIDGEKLLEAKCFK